MALNGKTIFITGGAGFIANKIISKYISDNKIIVYDNYHRDTLTGSPFNDHNNITIENIFFSESPQTRKITYYIGPMLHSLNYPEDFNDQYLSP